MSTPSLTRRRGTALLRPSALPTGLRAQLTVTGGQLAAGAGNLAFALVLARLSPRDYAQVAAFLAAYLLIHVPLVSLTADSALRPASVARLRRRSALLGGAGAVLVAACALPLSGPLQLPPLLVVALATTLPVAGALALERGRLLAEGEHSRAAATLLIEPVVRLALGVALASRFGAIGAAAGVVLGGYAALAVAMLGRSRPPGGRRAGTAVRDGADPTRRTVAARAATITAADPVAVTAAFALLALVQTQDALWANGLLASEEAGRFAVLSTLGGVAAFATTTVPLVLLPRAARGEPGALRTALLLASGLGVAAVLPFLIAPEPLVGLLFGERYAGVGQLAVPYLAAMGLLGVARVLLAHRCATGSGRGVVVVVAGAGALQAVLLITGPMTAAAVGQATLIATTALMLGALTLRARDTVPALRPRRGADDIAADDVPTAPVSSGLAPDAPPAPPRVPLHRRADARIVGAFTVAALVLRLLSGRSLWLDEATSVAQSHLPFAQMIDSLKSGDVHPPLHDVILWLLVRVAGDSELVVRLPSLLAGIVLIPVLYLAGRELWDRRAGLAAAALATVAPFPVWYAQEARMYALFLLFAAIAIFGQTRALRRGDATGWVIYAVATMLLVWTHYFALLFIAVQQVAFLLILGRRPWARDRLLGYGASLAAIAIASAPALLLARSQFAANEAAGKGFSAAQSQLRTSTLDGGHGVPEVYDALTNGVWALLGYHSAGTMASLTALWPVLILGGLLVLGRGAGRSGRLMLALVVLPMLALFALGQIKPFVFEIRYATGAVPAVLLLVSRVLTRWVPGRVAVVAATVVTCMALATATADQQLSRTNPRLYDFEGAITRIEHEARPGDVLLYEPPYLNDLVRYYAKDTRSAPLNRGIPDVPKGGRIFVMGSFLEDRTLRAATAKGLARLASDHRLVDRFTRPQVRVWEYRR